MIPDLLALRAHYVDRYKHAVSSYRKQGRNVFEEVCFELNRPNVAAVYRLFVVDIIERDVDGSTSVIEVNVDPIHVEELSSLADSALVWNGIVFVCSQAGFRAELVEDWANRWIHDESPPFGGQDELTGIIHSVTEPSILENHIEFSVDFGSAPLAAYEELSAILNDVLLAVRSPIN